MSMDPVVMNTEAGLVSRGKDLNENPGSRAAAPTRETALEHLPERNTALRNTFSERNQRAQDAVEVHRENGNHIVIRYLDHAGGVILQVPSAQVLGLQNAIRQALEDQERGGTQPDKLERREGAGNDHQP
jgi:hypothetical protein